MPPPSSFTIKGIAPQTHLNTLNSGPGCAPRPEPSGIPRPPARAPAPKRRKYAYSETRLWAPEEEIADVEHDATSRTEYHGSQSSFARSISPGRSEFQVVESSIKHGQSRSNRRRRQPQPNRPSGATDHVRRSGMDRETEHIESFDELGPAPKPGPWQQRTARLISTSGVKPPVIDSADYFILGKRSRPAQHLRSESRGKKRPSREIIDDHDEPVDGTNVKKPSSPSFKPPPNAEPAKHTSPGLSRRGDIRPTKWAGKSDTVFVRVHAAVCLPNLRYQPLDGHKPYLLRPTDAHELRAFTNDGNVAESYDWLKITRKAKALIYHPESDLIRINQPMDPASQVGRMMMVRFFSNADALLIVDWVRQKLRVDCQELEKAKLVQMYDKVLGDVSKAAAQPSTRRLPDVASTHPAPRVQVSPTAPFGLRDRPPSSARAPLRHQMKLSSQRAPEPAFESAPSESRSMKTRRAVEQSRRSDSPRPPVIHRWTEEHPDWAKDWEMPLMFHRTTVDQEDIPRLDEGECLNDNLIGFGLRYLFDKFESRHPDLQERVYLHNSFFYEKLKGPRGSINYDGVKSWTAKVDLLSYDYIVIPVNEHFHWWVAIICNPGKLDPESKAAPAKTEVSSTELEDIADRNSSDVEMADATNDKRHVRSRRSPTADELELVKSDIVDLVSDDKNARQSARRTDLTAGPRARQGKKAKSEAKPYNPGDPKIITLDSLGSSHPQAITHLKKYLLAEFEHKRNKAIANPSPQLGMRANNIPEQNNLCDCGVYLLGYIQEFVKDPDRFIQTLLRKDPPDWELNPSQLRNLWRETIQVEHSLYQKHQQKVQQKRCEASAAKCTPKGSVEPGRHPSQSNSTDTNVSDGERATGMGPEQSASSKTAGTPGNPDSHEVDDFRSDEPGTHEPRVNGNKPSRSPDPPCTVAPQRQLPPQESPEEDVILLPFQEDKAEILPSIEAPDVEELPGPPNQPEGHPKFIAQLASSPSSGLNDVNLVAELNPNTFYTSTPARSRNVLRKIALSSPVGGQRWNTAKTWPTHTANHFVVDGSPDLDVPVVEKAEVVRRSEPIDLT